MTVSLIPIERDGSPRGHADELTGLAEVVSAGTVGLYNMVGFREPWICYFGVADGRVVGTCGFKSPPQDGRVEIAYFTFPEEEGRGFATAMAAELVRLAQQHQIPVIAAQTLPERNASHRVLEKLGFCFAATVDHPEDGRVWEWHLANSQTEARHRSPDQ